MTGTQWLEAGQDGMSGGVGMAGTDMPAGANGQGADCAFFSDGAATVGQAGATGGAGQAGGPGGPGFPGKAL